MLQRRKGSIVRWCVSQVGVLDVIASITPPKPPRNKHMRRRKRFRTPQTLGHLGRGLTGRRYGHLLKYIRILMMSSQRGSCLLMVSCGVV
jgi:hypothetical protein